MDEAKKEAQKAILRLWPMGVKYQHYIDEGLDESVVKPLFEALRLESPADVCAVEVCHGICALLDVRGAAVVAQRCGVHVRQHS